MTASARQGVLSVFLREPLLDWQKEARVVRSSEKEYAGLKVCSCHAAQGLNPDPYSQRGSTASAGT